MVYMGSDYTFYIYMIKCGWLGKLFVQRKVNQTKAMQRKLLQKQLDFFSLRSDIHDPWKPLIMMWNRPMLSLLELDTQPTTSDHINIKYIWGPRGKPNGDHTLITYRELKKLHKLNIYNFSMFICYLETMKILVTHIHQTYSVNIYSYNVQQLK